ncbi:MAG: glycosyltransferase family 39 protein [Actinomycetota bacterium]
MRSSGELRSDTERAADDPVAHRRFLATIVALVIVGLWIPQIGSSFRLDETATHWIVRDGVSDAVTRSTDYQPEPPGYFVGAWLTRTLLGGSETSLRLLSVVALLLATWLLIRTVQRLVDSETGWLAGGLFVASQGVAFAAGDARPYGVSLAATMGVAFFLVRWIEDARKGDAAAIVLLSATAIYLQYFSAVILAGFGLTALALSRDRRRRTQLVAMVVALAVLLIPAAIEVLAIARRRDMLAVSFPVSLPRLAEVILPPVLLLGLFAGALVARLRGRMQIEPSNAKPMTFWLVLPWLLILPIALYAISRLGSTTIFEPRYFIIVSPAIAIIAALGIRSIGPPAARRTMLLAVAVLSLVAFASVTHSPDDWRGAARLVNERVDATTPVFIRPAYIESTRIDWLRRPDKRAYLLSPLSSYPMNGRIELMPYALDPPGRRYVDQVLAAILPVPRLLYVSLTPDDIGLWLRGRLEATGYTRTHVSAGSVSVDVYERS